MPGPDGTMPKPVMPGPPPSKHLGPYSGSAHGHHTPPPPAAGQLPYAGQHSPSPLSMGPAALPSPMQPSRMGPPSLSSGAGSQASSRGSTPPFASGPGMPPPPSSHTAFGPPPLAGFVRSTPSPW
jgi:hypothetical protein